MAINLNSNEEDVITRTLEANQNEEDLTTTLRKMMYLPTTNSKENESIVEVDEVVSDFFQISECTKAILQYHDAICTSNVNTTEATCSSCTDEICSPTSTAEVTQIDEGVDELRIALQFPDELLVFSTRVKRLLQENYNKLLQRHNDTNISGGSGDCSGRRRRRSSKVVIMADSSFSSCCVDELSSTHLSSNLIIHYSNSCLSRTSRLPVIYCFGTAKIDTTTTVSTLHNSLLQHFKLTKITAPTNNNLCDTKHTKLKVITFYEEKLHHASKELQHSFQQQTTTLSNTLFASNGSDNSAFSISYYLASIALPPTCAIQMPHASDKMLPDKNKSNRVYQLLDSIEQQQVVNKKKNMFFGRQLSDEVQQLLESEAQAESNEKVVIVWLGEDNKAFRNIQMSLNYKQVECFRFSIASSTLITMEQRLISRQLMKRYMLIQKAADAETFGIIAGTLAVARYKEIIESVKKMITNAGKQYYLLLVGKLNPAKLANFAELDMFVLITCPFECIIESRDYYKPIISAFELQIALVRGKEWTGKYNADFEYILDNENNDKKANSNKKQQEDGEEEEDEEEEDVRFSLASNRILPNHKHKHFNPATNTTSTDLVTRNTDTSISTAASFMQKRSWKGLEMKLGETEVTEAVAGRDGIACEYDIVQISTDKSKVEKEQAQVQEQEQKQV